MGFTGKNRILMLSGFFVLIIILVVCVNNSTILNGNLVTENLVGNDFEFPLANGGDGSEGDGSEGDGSEGDGSEGDDSEEVKESFTTDIPSCLPKDQLMPQELLPQDSESNQWSLANPQGSGSLKDKNFLQSGYHVGINTVGQTLRNANMQLRSDPPNPQVQVSPWQQTTINPDTNRKPMEIGGCA